MTEKKKTSPKKKDEKIILSGEQEAQINDPYEKFEKDEAGNPGRRVKIVMVNPWDFIGLLTKGMKFRRYTEVMQGIPADATVEAMSADTNRHGIMFVISSPTYDFVPVTQMPPIQMLEIQTELKNATKAKRKPRKKR